MTRAFASSVAIALAALTAVSPALQGQAAPPPAGQPQSSSFRSGIDLVSLTVTATDGSGRYVTDLDQQDFEIYEDGVRQDVTFFTKTNLTLAVSLLLDTSASMDEKMGIAQTAAKGFIRQLRPQDQAELIDFDSKVNVAVPFTNDQALLGRGIQALTAGGSTALYNAIYIALKELKKIQARTASELRRQAIVVLSDGEDTSSLVSFEEVLDLAKRSETAIYAIGLKSKDVLTGKGFHEADYVLRQLTTQTGGRVFFPANPEELPAIYQQISDELSSQYALGYSSKNSKRDGRWRRVVVRVARPGINARTKQGYYGPAL